MQTTRVHTPPVVTVDVRLDTSPTLYSVTGIRYPGCRGSMATGAAPEPDTFEIHAVKVEGVEVDVNTLGEDLLNRLEDEVLESWNTAVAEARCG